jgi:pimeloyl-ACP methyl ester carboxylesterase
VITLRHGRIELALHELRGATDGVRPLVHLHGLGLRSPADVPRDLAEWGGAIYALDFTGHGASTIPRAGGYTAETLLADVDAVVEYLGEVTLIGRGLGAYIALLTAGARADAVKGAILCDGPGIGGGGSAPGTPTVVRVDLNAPAPPDPFALAELSKDVRPPDYAIEFANLAHRNMRAPLAIVARARPEWLQAVADEISAPPMTLTQALHMYGR